VASEPDDVTALAWKRDTSSLTWKMVLGKSPRVIAIHTKGKKNEGGKIVEFDSQSSFEYANYLDHKIGERAFPAKIVSKMRLDSKDLSETLIEIEYARFNFPIDESEFEWKALKLPEDTIINFKGGDEFRIKGTELEPISAQLSPVTEAAEKQRQLWPLLAIVSAVSLLLLLAAMYKLRKTAVA
jgi:hypothetical protein